MMTGNANNANATKKYRFGDASKSCSNQSIEQTKQKIREIFRSDKKISTKIKSNAPHK